MILHFSSISFAPFLFVVFPLSANCPRSRMSCRRRWRSKHCSARNSVRRKRSCSLNSCTNETPAHLFTYLPQCLLKFLQADLVSAPPPHTLDSTHHSLVYLDSRVKQPVPLSFSLLLVSFQITVLRKLWFYVLLSDLLREFLDVLNHCVTVRKYIFQFGFIFFILISVPVMHFILE